MQEPYRNHKVCPTVCWSYILSIKWPGRSHIQASRFMAQCIVLVIIIHPNQRYIDTCGTMYMNVRFIFWTCSKIYLPHVLNRYIPKNVMLVNISSIRPSNFEVVAYGIKMQIGVVSIYFFHKTNIYITI